MAPYLPQEILTLIARHLGREDDHKLTPYTLVNKSWQAAFERQIYASVVVLSPSDVTTVTISPPARPENQHIHRHEKRGLHLARLIETTSGPQHWRQARRGYIRHILYRVAVPYWINPLRYDAASESYFDSSWRRENNRVFSEGIRRLFEYHSPWTEQEISLDIALQAEMAYVNDCDIDDENCPDNCGYHEPGTGRVETKFDMLVPPYNAELLPDTHLPKAKCVTSLNFPRLYLPDMTPGPKTNKDNCMNNPENGILVPTVIEIAAACGSLQTLNLNGEYGTSYASHILRMQIRDKIAIALSQLPSSIKYLQFIGDWPYCCFGGDGPQEDAAFHEVDTLSTAFRELSTRLTSLHTSDEAIFSELFCVDGTPGLLGDLRWPYLESLHLDCAWEFLPWGSMQRYAGYDYESLDTQYFEDLVEGLGFAAQRMPRLKDVVVDSHFFREHQSQGLTLCFREEDGRWKLSLSVYESTVYEPSLRVLEAWKVTSNDLQVRTGIVSEGIDGQGIERKYWEATYPSWPPL